MAHAIATLAGGCFWCIETVFNRLRGVESAVSGYMGGHTTKPTYKDICNGDTGHAEVVQVTFDPDVISYRELLDVFFTLHDPTQLNRQGNDVGTQYRSAIFWHTPEQKAEAEVVIAELTASKQFGTPIVTEVDRGGDLLSGRGLPPALLRAEPASAVLPVRGGAEGGEGGGEVWGATQVSRSEVGL